MKSRMSKYYDNNNSDVGEFVPSVSSRTKRNQNLYKEVSSLEIEDFDLNSNASVIGDNSDNIDINEIKGIIEEKYHVNKKKKSFGDSSEAQLPEIHLDETREYDIKSLLEKAKDKKEVNYEEERLKKVRNSQIDILKDLEALNKSDSKKTKEDKMLKNELTKEEIVKSNKKSKKGDKEQQLVDLIDTITAKELINSEKLKKELGESKEESELAPLDPLDIFTDLRGDNENTKVMGALVSDNVEEELDEDEITRRFENFLYEDNNRKNNLEDTLDFELRRKQEEKKKTKDNFSETHYFNTEELGNMMETKTLEIEKSDTSSLEQSLLDNTKQFTQNDFDDFKDLNEDMNVSKVIVNILVVLIILIFIAGCVVLLNKFLNLGLF